MKAIRFGEIPTSGRSLNYMKLTGDQRNDVAEMDHSRLEEEIKKYISYCYSWRNVDFESLWEVGVSVFEEKDGLPIIRNEKQARSLKNRLDDVIYLVEGEQVGTGEDGEPLLKITKAEKVTIDRAALEALV